MSTRALTISSLKASVEGKQILNGVSLSVSPGTVHAVMGPNGSGKSTLAYAIMGHPAYELLRPTRIQVDGKTVTTLPTEERAKAGLFLALQSPIAIPGVTVVNLLRTASMEVQKGKEMPIAAFMSKLREAAAALHIDEAFLGRGIHDGFSGGEKKKIEMLQAIVLAPKYAIFDEIDTGLDVDALKVVAAGIAHLAKAGTGVIVITHYQRILAHLHPDVVHVMVKGKIVKTGTAALAKQIEEDGYNRYL